MQTTGGGPEGDERGAVEVTSHAPSQKRQKTALTVSVSLVPGDAGAVSRLRSRNTPGYCSSRRAKIAAVRRCCRSPSAGAGRHVSAAEGRVAFACAAAGLRRGARLCRDGAEARPGRSQLSLLHIVYIVNIVNCRARTRPHDTNVDSCRSSCAHGGPWKHFGRILCAPKSDDIWPSIGLRRPCKRGS